MQPTRQDGWREDCKQSNGVATNHKMPIESLTSIQSDPFIHATASICDACKSRPMIRHAPQSENSEAPQPLYFIDRQVYLALMQCHSRMVREGGPQDKPSESIQFLRGLYCAWETEGNWRPCHALCEVGARECMLEHEEDRVLSILGLLGLQVNNLRTGKSLKEQVISIIKEGGGVELVIEFCTMNQKGGKDAGFSWAPDFHGKNKKLEYALRPLHSDIEVFNHEFGQDGSLKLKAKIARGHVVPKDSTCPPHGHSACHSHLLIISRPTSSSSPDYLEIPLHLELAPHHKNIDPNTLFFGFHGFDDQTSLSGSFQVPLNPSSYAQACKSLNISYPVRLLLLGTDEGGSKLVMVCIPRHDQDGNTLEELHKIGCFALRKDKLLDFHALLQDAKEELCVVGGFGNDLSQHVQIHE